MNKTYYANIISNKKNEFVLFLKAYIEEVNKDKYL